MITSAAYPPAPLDPIISRLRPRTVAEVIDQAFRLYRRHFLTFLAIIAVVHVPLQLLIQGANIWLLTGVTDITNESISGDLSSSQVMNETAGLIAVLYVVVLGLSFLYGILQYLSQGALTAAIADAHMDRPISFGRAYGAMFKHIGPLLGFMVLQILISIGIFVPVIVVFVLAAFGVAAAGSDSGALGFGAICFACFLIIPAILFSAYVFVRLSMVVPAIVIENLGPIEAMRRSWRLVQNYWWRTAAILLVLSILSFVIAAGPAAVIVAIVGLVTRSFDQVMINAVSGVVTVITAAFFVPLDLTARTLYYFDLRVRKEGFDLDTAMTQRYGQPGAPQTGFGGMQAAPAGAYAQTQAGGMSAPVLGYQQPADTRYLGGYTAPPGSGYTSPRQEENRTEVHTTEQATPPPDLDTAPDSSQEEQGNVTRDMSELETPPDDTPKQN
jgi:hypothetical protein